MSFWSGEKLAEELPKGLIVPYDEKNLDCASYRLCVGEQAFVTSDKFATSAPGDPLITILGDAPQHTLRIHPGQFAFLLTEEIVKVPSDAIALISMRAKYKFQGLINVSGFHVDPGWSGKLLFSVYNAGANEVIISKGEPLFLIVYSTLDRISVKVYDGSSKNQITIKTELISGMTGQVFSPLMLQRKMEDLKDQHIELREKAKTLETTTKVVATGLGLAVGIIGLFIATIAMVPNFTGVFLAKTLESAGYEVKQKEISSMSAVQTNNVDAAKSPSASASKPK